MKKELYKLNTQIKLWEEIVVKYPNNTYYENTLTLLLRARADLVSSIGRKKKLA